MFGQVPVRIKGEWFFYYDHAEHYMHAASWKRFVEEDIAHAWAWRRYGIDPPVGSTHAISWQMMVLSMMPLVYALLSMVADMLAP